MLSASNAAPARQQAVLLVKLLPLMSGLLIILSPSTVASMAPLAVVVFRSNSGADLGKFF
jgi:hypothetical protein